MQKQIISIITARGGSKGLKDKNIRTLHGKPLIAWSIQFALENSYIHDCIVSTDSNKIAEIAEEYGARIPFMRDKELSTDSAKTSDVIIDVINRCSLKPNDVFLLLEPTSPYRLHKSFKQCIEIFETNNLRKIVSVQENISTSFRFQFFRDIDTTMRPVISSDYPNNVRRQDIEKSFCLDGSFYMSYVSDFLNHPGFLDRETGSFINNYFSSFEIDSEEDLRLMQSIFSFIGTPF